MKEKMSTEDYLALGDGFLVHIKNVSSQKGRTVLESKTTSGSLDLKIWDYSGEPKTGDYLLVEVNDREEALKEFNEWKSVTITPKGRPGRKGHEYETVPEREVPDEVRKKINRDRKPQLRAAMEFLRDPSPWRNKELHAVVTRFVGENEKKFFTAPAATSRHHNWKGGLLVHTAEVASNCLAIASNPMNIPYEIDLDALLLAAWLHDAGKMMTYHMEGDKPEIDSDTENLVGHITISNQIFGELARKEKLEPGLVRQVSHCILSHHERREWGSPVEPQTIEAHILCRADFISSRMPD